MIAHRAARERDRCARHAEVAAAHAAELQQLIKSRLRSSRVPERVAFRDALPYNEMGKLLRRELRKQFSEP